MLNPLRFSVKINLGCGNNLKEGYVNIDLYSDAADVQLPLDDLPYEDGSISSIYCEHALEHVPHAVALNEWFRILEYKGVLNLLIPDLEECCRHYLEASGTVNGFPAKEWYKYTIFGIQRAENGSTAEGQFHYTGFSMNEISNMLTNIGFEIVNIFKYNGYGTPSLNITATKP